MIPTAAPPLQQIEVQHTTRRDSLQERVFRALVGNPGLRAMPREDDRLRVEREEMLPDRLQLLLRVAPGQIGQTDAAAEQRVAREDQSLGVNAAAALGVP